MQAKPPPTIQLMFCKRCRYNLKAIESRACPECGRAFDPQNRKTYRKRVGWPKWVRRIGQGLVVLFVMALIALGVIEWRYQREAGVAEQFDGAALWSDDAHPWAAWIPLLHERLQHVVWLDLDDNQLAALPPEIGKLLQLEWLDLSDNQFTTLPPEIGKFTQLMVLWLRDNQLTTLSPELGKLTKLEELGLSDNLLTTLPPELGNLTNLVSLWLHGNPITDAGLEHLKVLENLRQLSLGGTKVTAQGVAALKLAIPNCEITSDFD